MGTHRAGARTRSSDRVPPTRPWRTAVAATAILVPLVLTGDATAKWSGGVVETTRLSAPSALSDNPLGATGTLPESLRPADVQPAQPSDSGQVTGSRGIPGAALAAYRTAERSLARTTPRCGLDWPLLAAIGRIESGHARGGAVDARGNTLAPILGPRLDGSAGFAAIPATDGGRLTGDPVWDHAVGPMQFIPATWRTYAPISNAKGYGEADPNNIYDSALAAGNYLCAAGGDMRDPRQRAAAVFSYNHSDSYVRTVLRWADAYASGASVVPDATEVPPVVLMAQRNPVVGPPATPSANPDTSSPAPTSSSTTTAATTTTMPTPTSSTPPPTTATTPPPTCPTTQTTTPTSTTTPPSDGCPTPTATTTSSGQVSG